MFCSGSIAVLQLVAAPSGSVEAAELQLVAASLGSGEAMTRARLVPSFLVALFLFLALVS